MSINSYVHRATVTYADSVSGEIRVVCPALGGSSTEINVSLWGRSPQDVGAGVYKYTVPAIGSKVVVAADDEYLTNVFIIKIEGQL